MQYQGGKERIARKLADVMLSRRTVQETYLEPFVGGASVLARMAPHFSKSVASDSATDLITLWEAAAEGWVPPESLSREEHRILRLANDPTNPLTAFSEIGCTFGGCRGSGFASNARGDNFARAAARGIARKAATLGRTTFLCCDYSAHQPGAETLAYCDPPYAGTTPYKGAPKWDVAKFWETVNNWTDAGALVFVSEYVAPEGWVPVWEKVKRVTLNDSQNLTEKLERLWVRG